MSEVRRRKEHSVSMPASFNGKGEKNKEGRARTPTADLNGRKTTT